ncbi:MAG: hypothetical protein EXS64_02605 [Candidatus Latescibacteria bacterium]|nr:hypothetical protein [Candidatus Latescibacterota bacterium]
MSEEREEGVRVRVSEDDPRIEEGARQDRGVTFRAILFGLFISIGVSLLANTVRYVLHGSFMAYSHMPMSNLILFLLSIFGCAFLARWLGKRFVFSSTEWITIFCMGFISALGPTYGSSGYLVGLMVSPYYFATPENEWVKYLHPYLPTWLIPTNEGNAMAWFYEGLPRGASIPWGVWAIPLMWWFAFIFAVGFACACASVIMHRQWAENEKLVYPAMTPIVEMTTRAGSGERFLPEFVQGKAFWAGFALTSFVFWWNMIAWFYPQFPQFPTADGRWIFFSQNYPPAWIFLSTVVICFSYFASLDILFSIWFFDLLFIIEGGALNRLGVSAISPYYGTGRYIWQTAGGYVVLVLWGLWIARLHLRDVFRKALHPERSPIDDSGEMLSYRGAFIGLAVSCLFMAVWLGRAGMEAKVIVLLIPAMLLVYTGLSKILADSGLIYANPPTLATSLSIAALGGANAVGASTHAAFALSSSFVNHYKGFAMSAMAHVARLGDFVPKGKRRLFWAVCAAFAVGIVASTLFTIWLGYTLGGYNFNPNWLIISAGVGQYQWAVDTIKAPTAMETPNYWFFLSGAGVMAFLNLMRYRFVWWPFHPIGFALSGTALARLTSFTILVAWLLKLVMLKLVGASFYRKSRPFFFGMLIGYILAIAAGVAVDALWFPDQGHMVHKWY